MHTPQKNTSSKHRKTFMKVHPTDTRTVKQVHLSRSQWCGYGFTLSSHRPCVLSCVIRHSPAQIAGLQAGDALQVVNGVQVAQASHDEVVGLIGRSRGILRLLVTTSTTARAAVVSDRPWDSSFSGNQKRAVHQMGGTTHWQCSNGLPLMSDEAAAAVDFRCPNEAWKVPLANGAAKPKIRSRPFAQGTVGKRVSYSCLEEEVETFRSWVGASSLSLPERPQDDSWCSASQVSFHRELTGQEYPSSYSAAAAAASSGRQGDSFSRVVREVVGSSFSFVPSCSRMDLTGASAPCMLGPATGGYQLSPCAPHNTPTQSPYNGDSAGCAQGFTDTDTGAQVFTFTDTEAQGFTFTDTEAQGFTFTDTEAQGFTFTDTEAQELTDAHSDCRRPAASSVQPDEQHGAATPEISSRQRSPHRSDCPKTGATDTRAIVGYIGSIPLPDSVDNTNSSSSKLASHRSDCLKTGATDTRAIVGYIGSIPLPDSVYNSNSSSSKLVQQLSSCVRQLLKMQRQHTPLLMEIGDYGVRLTSSTGGTVAFYPAGRVIYSGVCPDHRHIFGIITTTTENNSSGNDCVTERDHLSKSAMEKETVFCGRSGVGGGFGSCSCHVFMVDPFLVCHERHVHRATAFRLRCRPGAVSQLCDPFPQVPDGLVRRVSAFCQHQDHRYPATDYTRPNAHPHADTHLRADTYTHIHHPHIHSRSDGVSQLTVSDSSEVPGHHDSRKNSGGGGGLNMVQGEAFGIQLRFHPSSAQAVTKKSRTSTRSNRFRASERIFRRHTGKSFPSQRSASPEYLSRTRSALPERLSCTSASAGCLLCPRSTLHRKSSCASTSAESISGTSASRFLAFSSSTSSERVPCASACLGCLSPNPTPADRLLQASVNAAFQPDSSGPAECLPHGSTDAYSLGSPGEAFHTVSCGVPPHASVLLSHGKGTEKRQTDGVSSVKSELTGKVAGSLCHVVSLDRDAHTLDRDTRTLNRNTHSLDRDTHTLDRDTHTRTEPIPSSCNISGSENQRRSMRLLTHTWSARKRYQDSEQSLQNGLQGEPRAGSIEDGPRGPCGSDHHQQQQQQQHQQQQQQHHHRVSRSASDAGTGHQRSASAPNQTVDLGCVQSSRLPNIGFLMTFEAERVSLGNEGRQLARGGATEGREESGRGRVAEWGLRFSALLADPLGVSVFTEFLRSEHSEENIMFWTDVETYRRLPDQNTRGARAQELYARYLGDSASDPINVDCVARAGTLRAVDSASPNAFDIAQRQIYHLMQTDCYRRFLTSDVYKGHMAGERAGRTLHKSPEADPDTPQTTEQVTCKEKKRERKKSFMLWRTNTNRGSKEATRTSKEATRTSKEATRTSKEATRTSKESAKRNDLINITKESGLRSEATEDDRMKCVKVTTGASKKTKSIIDCEDPFASSPSLCEDGRKGSRPAVSRGCGTTLLTLLAKLCARYSPSHPPDP